MKILQVNTYDTIGGAARIAASLHKSYRDRNHQSWLAVGYKFGKDKHTLPIKQDLTAPIWQRPFWRGENIVAHHRFRGARVLRNALRMAANPRRISDWYHGYEDFRFPGTKNLLDLPNSTIDILHLHNLHGTFFDLRLLPQLTSEVPTILTLHDAWLLSGHCAFSFDCERWRKGCGHCPDLSIPPAIWRDGTAENWQRKKSIYSGSRYYIVTPSKWLMNRISGSILAKGLVDSRVIHLGIDLDTFKPGDKLLARRRLNLPETGIIILMVANGFRDNPWKDFKTARETFKKLRRINNKNKITILALGDNLPDEHYKDTLVHYIPYIPDKRILAGYYQAADLFLSTSKIEVWGLAISEALACGTPVVATAVGGIPEQVTSWSEETQSRANGILIEPGNSVGLAEALMYLLRDDSLRNTLRHNSILRARTELNFETKVDSYLDYYRKVLADWKRKNDS